MFGNVWCHATLVLLLWPNTTQQAVCCEHITRQQVEMCCPVIKHGNVEHLQKWVCFMEICRQVIDAYASNGDAKKLDEIWKDERPVCKIDCKSVGGKTWWLLMVN